MTMQTEKLCDLYERVFRARAFEDALIKYASQDGVYVGHPYRGQEGVASGICCALERGDSVVSYHRSHGHAVAQGCNLEALALELYGKPGGTCRGRAGEMYISEPAVGFIGATQVVGGNMGMAAGLALTASLASSKPTAAVAVFIGEGAVNQGIFHESLNLAAIWRLPVLVVVENNGFAEATPSASVTAGDICDRARSYGISAATVDGQDALSVYREAIQALEIVRSGEGPMLIEARTYRYLGHYYGDQHTRYRSADDVDNWKARDPVSIMDGHLAGAGLQLDLATIREGVLEEVERAFANARTAASFELCDLHGGVYSRGLEAVINAGVVR